MKGKYFMVLWVGLVLLLSLTQGAWAARITWSGEVGSALRNTGIGVAPSRAIVDLSNRLRGTPSFDVRGYMGRVAGLGTGMNLPRNATEADLAAISRHFLHIGQGKTDFDTVIANRISEIRGLMESRGVDAALTGRLLSVLGDVRVQVSAFLTRYPQAHVRSLSAESAHTKALDAQHLRTAFGSDASYRGLWFVSRYFSQTHFSEGAILRGDPLFVGRNVDVGGARQTVVTVANASYKADLNAVYSLDVLRGGAGSSFDIASVRSQADIQRVTLNMEKFVKNHGEIGATLAQSNFWLRQVKSFSEDAALWLNMGGSSLETLRQSRVDGGMPPLRDVLLGKVTLDGDHIVLNELGVRVPVPADYRNVISNIHKIMDAVRTSDTAGTFRSELDIVRVIIGQSRDVMAMGERYGVSGEGGLLGRVAEAMGERQNPDGTYSGRVYEYMAQLYATRNVATNSLVMRKLLETLFGDPRNQEAVQRNKTYMDRLRACGKI